MIIKVGTNNPVKVESVKEALADYPSLADAEIIGVNVTSGVDEQPKTLDETVIGSLNRALNAYVDGADLGIGIESGLMLSPLGWINFTSAVIVENRKAADIGYPIDGVHYGHSTGFPLPNKIVDKIINEGMDLDAAAYACGFVDVPNIGKVDGGFLGVLTKGRVSRKTYSKQALMMALISWENKEMFVALNEN